MEHHTHSTPAPNKGLSLAFWLNLVFAMVEVAGGIFTNSGAILADAFHDFMDALAIGGAVALDKLSQRKRSAVFSYGYRRFSLLSALALSLFLLVGCGFMLSKGIEHLMKPEPVNSAGMFWLAILGILVNGLAVLRIRHSNAASHPHSHSHSHSHSDLNSRAIMLHLLEDVLGWVAVLLGAVIIYYTGWYWIDALLTLSIALFIGYNATRNLIATLKILLQSVPETVEVEHLTAELKAIQGIEDIHDLHIWSLDGNYNIATLHAVVKEENRSDRIYSAITSLMKKYGIQHPTVQLETAEQQCALLHC